MPAPKARKLLTDVKKEFESEDAAVPVAMLLGFLWDDQEVFNTFTDKFLTAFCNQWKDKNPNMLISFLGLVVHRLFVDLTAQVQDWRVVNIQERFIHQMI